MQEVAKKGLLKAGAQVVEDNKELAQLWKRIKNDAEAWLNISPEQQCIEALQEITTAGLMGAEYVRQQKLQLEAREKKK